MFSLLTSQSIHNRILYSEHKFTHKECKMNENNNGLRIVSALVLIAAIAAIAFLAFQAGVAKGSPVTIEAPSGQTVPAPYPYYGYGMPFYRPWGFGFGFFGFLIPLFLFFLALRALRFLFW